MRLIYAAVGLAIATLANTQLQGQDQTDPIRSRIDAYIDQRFDADEHATDKLLIDLTDLGKADIDQLEKALRSRRAEYPDATQWKGKYTKHEVECLHVDYASTFWMYVPEDFDGTQPVPLVVVGHGGNSSMSPRRAEATADAYIKAYAPAMSEELGAIIVAPATSRGWGNIGNSLIFSTISKVQRMMPVDPDKIYITGQSMGGHLSFRSALALPDRFGAVSPNSGGYDFVEKKSIGNLINVPGYAIWGTTEPYGINTDNNTNARWAESDWAVENDLNWRFVEKNGGHTIYIDELPSVAEFFAENPRNLYRDKVYMRQGTMLFEKTWGVKGWPDHEVYHDTRPFRWNMRHWLQIEARPGEGPLTIFAHYVGDNQFEITSHNVRDLSVFLHSKMVDFDKPIQVSINGELVFNEKVEKDPKLMFDLAREFDDRGRIFHARLDLKTESDQEIDAIGSVINE